MFECCILIGGPGSETSVLTVIVEVWQFVVVWIPYCDVGIQSAALTSLHIIIPHENIAIDSRSLSLIFDFINHVSDQCACIQPSLQRTLFIRICLNINPNPVECFRAVCTKTSEKIFDLLCPIEFAGPVAWRNVQHNLARVKLRGHCQVNIQVSRGIESVVSLPGTEHYKLAALVLISFENAIKVIFRCKSLEVYSFDCECCRYQRC